jgi:hypothetical protein
MFRVRRISLGVVLAALVALILTLDAGASGGGQEIVVRVEQGGFRWSDAAVGLLAGVGSSAALAGCLALMRLRGAAKRTSTKGEQP